MSRQRLELCFCLTIALGGPYLTRTIQAAVPSVEWRTSDPTDTELFVPARPRDEADEDRVLSAAMFSQGRLLFQRDRPEEALRYYQRAYRFSNGSQTVLHEVVQLAFRLGQLDVAARYALLAAPDTALDPFVLRRLALHLTDMQQFEQAVQLYERTQPKTASNEPPSDAEIVTQFELGRLHFLSQQFEPAADAFERLLPLLTAPAAPTAKKVTQALLEDAPLTFAVMGEAFLRAGRLDQAAAVFAKAYPADEQSSLLAFHLARIAEGAQRPGDVLQQLDVYFQQPEEATGVIPFRLLKAALTELGQVDQLRPRLVTLHEQYPENRSLTYFLGQEQLTAGEFEAATGLFEQLQAAQPGVDADRGLILVALQQQQPDPLLHRLAEAVAREGDLTPLAETLQSIPQDPVLWSGLIDRVRQQQAAGDPRIRSRALAIAQLALQAKQFQVADEFYALAAGTPPAIDPEIGTRWALDMLRTERTERAAQLLQDLIALQPSAEQSGELHFYLAGCLAIHEQYPEALTAAKTAAELLPEIPSVELRPAWVLYLAQRWPEAERAYQAFLDKFDHDYGSPIVRDAVREAKLSLSNLCVHRQCPAEAEEWLEKVLDEFPEDVGAMNDLGYLWADRQVHLQRALRMTRQAVEAEPDNLAYRDSYGWALHQLGHHADAVAELQRACETEKPDGIILDHLGDALQKSGDHDAACAAWQQALTSLAPEDETRRKTIQSKLDRFRME